MLQDTVSVQKMVISQPYHDVSTTLRQYDQYGNRSASLQDRISRSSSLLYSKLWHIPEEAAPLTDTPSFSSRSWAVLGISQRRNIAVVWKRCCRRDISNFQEAAAPFVAVGYIWMSSSPDHVRDLQHPRNIQPNRNIRSQFALHISNTSSNATPSPSISDSTSFPSKSQPITTYFPPKSLGMNGRAAEGGYSESGECADGIRLNFHTRHSTSPPPPSQVPYIHNPPPHTGQLAGVRRGMLEYGIKAQLVAQNEWRSDAKDDKVNTDGGTKAMKKSMKKEEASHRNAEKVVNQRQDPIPPVWTSHTWKLLWTFGFLVARPMVALKVKYSSATNNSKIHV
ncbi:hypothetical protein C8J56DRAFT_891179 [Mycena floridula]|nr:hypothetical protein C8J56DRAFT_891179 [Mycena floridula]